MEWRTTGTYSSEKLEAKPGKGDEVQNLLTAIHAFANSSSEPGCLTFRTVRSVWTQLNDVYTINLTISLDLVIASKFLSITCSADLIFRLCHSLCFRYVNKDAVSKWVWTSIIEVLDLIDVSFRHFEGAQFKKLAESIPDVLTGVRLINNGFGVTTHSRLNMLSPRLWSIMKNSQVHSSNDKFILMYYRNWHV